jgi:drug/metabolite transporter (DMT)-like permease
MAVAAALTSVVLWASAFVGIRAAADDFTPGALTLGRIVVAALALGAIAAVRRERLPSRRDLVRIAAYGLLWFGAYSVLLNAGEQRVDAGTAAMLVNVAPVFIALLAGWLLREGFPRALIVGCGIAFAGTVLIGVATRGRSVDAGWGAVLCVAAAATYSMAVVIQKPLLERVGGLQITFLACVAGLVACLPFAPQLVDEAGRASGENLAWVAYLGVFPTAIGFTTWAYALKRTSAGRMGAITYLVPPIAILLGWVMLGETPPSLAFAGGGLCLAGVAMTRAGFLTTLSEVWRGSRFATVPAAAATRTSSPRSATRRSSSSGD